MKTRRVRIWHISSTCSAARRSNLATAPAVFEVIHAGEALCEGISEKCLNAPGVHLGKYGGMPLSRVFFCRIFIAEKGGTNRHICFFKKTTCGMGFLWIFSIKLCACWEKVKGTMCLIRQLRANPLHQIACLCKSFRWGAF